MGGRKSSRVRVPSRAPAPASMMRSAVRGGRTRAKQLVAARRKTLLSKAFVGNNGVLVAEGDSWFDYPLNDVLGCLEDNFGYRVESVAHKGDTLESMAYDDAQLVALQRRFERVQEQGTSPRAILLSGGGNDIAGDEFAVLLNHQRSQLPPLNAGIVDGIVNVRLRAALARLIGAVTEFSLQYFDRVIPVVVHGYGYAVPDGRGFLGGFWVLPGPWLEPGFRRKGYPDLSFNTAVVERLIDTFNAMLASLPGQAGLGHVRYVDLRPGLSNDLPSAYRAAWANELHPTPVGYRAVAAQFDAIIRSFPRP